MLFIDEAAQLGPLDEFPYGRDPLMRGYLRVERYVGGALFIGLGLTAAFAGNQKK